MPPDDPIPNDALEPKFLEVIEEQTGAVKGTIDNIKNIAENVRALIGVGTLIVSAFGLVTTVQINRLEVDIERLGSAQKVVDFQTATLANIDRLQDLATKAAKEKDEDTLTLLSDQVKALSQYNRSLELEYSKVADAQYSALGNFLVRKCMQLQTCSMAEVRALRDVLPDANEAPPVPIASTTQPNGALAPQQTAIEVATNVTNQKDINPRGWDIDVFTCPEVQAKTQAKKIADYLASAADAKTEIGQRGDQLGRIRYREMTEKNIQTLNARGQGIEVRANSDEQVLAGGLVELLRPLNLVPPMQKAQSSTSTPWYLSIIVCGEAS